MSSIATRTGDDGTTSLLYGQRVPKDHAQIAAVGACDELNVALGAVKLAVVGNDERKLLLGKLQKNLVALMGEIVCAESDLARYSAGKFEKLTEEDLARLDAGIVEIEARQPGFEGWATPGTNPPSLAWDQARVAARRAERVITTLGAHGRRVRPLVLQFINRLSDFLWLAARAAEN